MKKSNSRKKVLIIRFSSIGDIAQCLPSAHYLKSVWPKAEIHWLTLDEFEPIVEVSDAIEKVWTIKRHDPLGVLFRLILRLRQQNYSHVYDAHSNLRSHVVSPFLHGFWCFRTRVQFLRRSKNRIKRFLLFKFRKNLFPQPFLGMYSYLEPLNKWAPLNGPRPDTLSFPLRHKDLTSEFSSLGISKPYCALAPSAAWDLKKWPVKKWISLIAEMPNQNFCLLGGPEDHFCEKIALSFPNRVTNLAGKLTWLQSLTVLDQAELVVSGDTGSLHLADYLGRPTVALIGPSAFGYPTQNSSVVAEINLVCKPCTKDGRGKCVNSTYKKCMVELEVPLVLERINKVKSQNL